MKAFVAIDSFKGSLTTFEANSAAAGALCECGFSEDDISLFPVTDGGEGFCDVLSFYLQNAECIAVKVHAPSGNIIESRYLLCGGTAYIESASACGYTLVPDSERSPFKTTSFGLGEMIRDSVVRGAGRIVVGMGGTATCDGGVGMLQALGVKFFTENGILDDRTPAMLRNIVSIDSSSLERTSCSFELWSDTRAAFCGNSGAVRVFGVQKGIKPDFADAADSWMFHLAGLYGLNASFEGAGAAGGIGGALVSMFGAEIRSGALAVLDVAGFKEKLTAAGTDAIVLTGEGRFDSQTLTGKLPSVVADLAKASGSEPELICLAGSVNSSDHGPFDEVIPVSPSGIPLQEAMRKHVAERNLTAAVRSLFQSKKISIR